MALPPLRQVEIWRAQLARAPALLEGRAFVGAAAQGHGIANCERHLVLAGLTWATSLAECHTERVKVPVVRAKMWRWRKEGRKRVSPRHYLPLSIMRAVLRET